MTKFAFRISFAQIPYQFGEQARFQLVSGVHHVFHFAVVELIRQSVGAQQRNKLLSTFAGFKTKQLRVEQPVNFVKLLEKAILNFLLQKIELIIYIFVGICLFVHKEKKKRKKLRLSHWPLRTLTVCTTINDILHDINTTIYLETL